MAISPPSDIVLDVIRAADPLQSRAAAERLRGLAVAPQESAAFDEVFDALHLPPADPVPFDAAGTLVRLRNQETLATARPLDAAARAAPYVRFEALVLQSFIQSMLPDDASTVFGSGNTGAIWKSVLAEKLAEQMAISGGIGIAKHIAPRAPA